MGFHCPECVRAGNRAVRQPRTVFGGRIRARTGLVTYTLIGINVAVFVAQFGAQYVPQLGTSTQAVAWSFGMWPAEAVPGQWWRFVTSAFLHAGPAHILFNMLALFILGPQLEALLGRLRFATLYLLSALGGSTLIYVAGPSDFPTLGASGAIFGLFGATFVVARRLNLDTRWILGLLAINLVITFAIPLISWQGHIGGLVTGLALAFAYAYAPRSGRAPVHLGASAGLFLLILAASAVATLLYT